uniref:Endo-1,4-beta-xylanase n=1 Tax=Scheffersomyces stipitis TaxID=4924 RepID=Q9Y7F2_PICSP|nr:xylanase A [Scheffersomyces stipitis]
MTVYKRKSRVLIAVVTLLHVLSHAPTKMLTTDVLLTRCMHLCHFRTSDSVYTNETSEERSMSDRLNITRVMSYDRWTDLVGELEVRELKHVMSHRTYSLCDLSCSTVLDSNSMFSLGKGWQAISSRQGVGATVYGWTRSPSLIEYYVVDSWGSYHPSNTITGTFVTVKCDGGTYDIYTAVRVNAPSIEGTTFTQYWSVRQSATIQLAVIKPLTLQNATITFTFSNHFDAWKTMTSEATHSTEGYFSSGITYEQPHQPHRNTWATSLTSQTKHTARSLPINLDRDKQCSQNESQSAASIYCRATSSTPKYWTTKGQNTNFKRASQGTNSDISSRRNNCIQAKIERHKQVRTHTKHRQIAQNRGRAWHTVRQTQKYRGQKWEK